MSYWKEGGLDILNNYKEERLSILFGLENLDKFVDKSPTNPSVDVQSGNPTKVFVEDEVSLPEGMTIEDIRDAVSSAQGYLGVNFPIIVCVRKKISSERELSGQAVSLFGEFSHVDISPRDEKIEVHRIEGVLYTPGSAKEDLYATAFEETFHAARMILGEFDFASYYRCPAESTAEDVQKYLEQREEKLVEDALNGGILEEKFGRNTYLPRGG